MELQHRRLIRMWPYFALTCAAGIMLFFLLYVWRRIDPQQHFGDFGHFYAAAQAMDQGQSPYLSTAPGSDRHGYIYPPLIAFLYWPLAHFCSLIAAARVSLVVNMAALCAALWIGSRAMLERFGENLRAPRVWTHVLVVALGALLLSLDKTKGELQMLQTNTLILLALVLALWLLDRKPLWCGMALGFAMNIKYQALVMLPYLLLRRRWAAAGWMALWTCIWGMLPGFLVGFRTEARYLSMAFGGVLQLVGIDPGKGISADIANITAGYSVSITSGVARALQHAGSHFSPMIAAAALGLLWLAVGGFIYRRQGLHLIRWPAGDQQATEPWRRMIAVEWMVLIASTLSFSPQTNTRHLILAIIINLGALALLVGRRHAPTRWIVVAAVAILWAGLTLPPGNRIEEQSAAVHFWHNIGGPSWAMLVATAMIAWAGLGPNPYPHPAQHNFPASEALPATRG